MSLKSHVGVLTPGPHLRTPERRCPETGLCRRDEGKGGQRGLIHTDQCPYEKGRAGRRHALGGDHVRTWEGTVIHMPAGRLRRTSHAHARVPDPQAVSAVSGARPLSVTVTPADPPGGRGCSRSLFPSLGSDPYPCPCGGSPGSAVRVSPVSEGSWSPARATSRPLCCEPNEVSAESQTPCVCSVVGRDPREIHRRSRRGGWWAQGHEERLGV